MANWIAYRDLDPFILFYFELRVRSAKEEMYIETVVARKVANKKRVKHIKSLDSNKWSNSTIIQFRIEYKGRKKNVKRLLAEAVVRKSADIHTSHTFIK